MLKYLLPLLLMLAACDLPAVSVNPQPAPAGLARQFFSPRCETLVSTTPEAAYRPLQGVEPDACATYTVVPQRALDGLTVRLSGVDLYVDGPCEALAAFAGPDGTLLERLRCTFEATSNPVELYVAGTDLRATTEVRVGGERFFLNPLGP